MNAIERDTSIWRWMMNCVQYSYENLASGKRLEISAPAGLNLAQELCTTGGLYIWQDADGELREIRGEHVATAYVADTPGGRLLFVPNPGDGTSADIAELNAIVASIEIANPTPTASP